MPKMLDNQLRTDQHQIQKPAIKQVFSKTKGINL